MKLLILLFPARELPQTPSAQYRPPAETNLPPPRVSGAFFPADALAPDFTPTRAQPTNSFDSSQGGHCVRRAPTTRFCPRPPILAKPINHYDSVCCEGHLYPSCTFFALCPCFSPLRDRPRVASAGLFSRLATSRILHKSVATLAGGETRPGSSVTQGCDPTRAKPEQVRLWAAARLIALESRFCSDATDPRGAFAATFIPGLRFVDYLLISNSAGQGSSGSPPISFSFHALCRITLKVSSPGG